MKGGECSVCLQCGVEYSNILVSESIPFEEDEPVEISISMESTFVRRKTEVTLPLGINPAIGESIAV